MERRIQTGALITLTLIATAAALYWLRPVMIPFVLALFTAMTLSGVVTFLMRRLHLPRGPAVAGTLLLGALVLAGVAVVLWASVSQLSRNAQVYQAQSRSLLERVVSYVPSETVSQVGQQLTDTAVGSVGQVLVGTTNAVVSVLSQSLLVLIFVVFLLLGWGDRRGRSDGVLGEVEHRIERYLITKATVSGATGLLVGLILTVLGVDLALAFGLFAFLLNFIPSLGSLIATVLPLPIVLLDPETSPTVTILAIALPGAVQLTLGNVVEPKLMGESLDLHPVTVLLALIFWGMLWGIVGALLASPMTAVMKILLARLEPTAPLSELMAGRIPPTWSRP